MSTAPAPLHDNSDFRKLWLGQSVSEFGSRITRDGIPLMAVITLAASPAELGVLVAAASVPTLVVGLFAGVWVDRMRRRPILIALDLVRLSLLLLIPLAALTGTLSLPLLVVVTACASVCGFIFDLAYRALLPALVRLEDLLAANSRLATSDSLAEIGGPALAGVLIQIVSAPFALVFDALTFAFSAGCFALIRTREPLPEHPPDEDNMWTAIRAGIAELLRHPLLRTLALGMALRTFFGTFIGTLYGVYAVRDLGLSPAVLGMLISAGGAGALVGSVLSPRLTRAFGLRRVLMGALIVSGVVNFAIPLAGGGFAAVVVLLATAQIAGDAAMVVYMINELTYRQMNVPDHLLGRTNASFGFLAEGISPAGALIAGALATAVGTRVALLVAVGGILLTALWVSYTFHVRRDEMQTTTE